MESNNCWADCRACAEYCDSRGGSEQVEDDAALAAREDAATNELLGYRCDFGDDAGNAVFTFYAFDAFDLYPDR